MNGRTVKKEPYPLGEDPDHEAWVVRDADGNMVSAHADETEARTVAKGSQD